MKENRPTDTIIKDGKRYEVKVSRSTGKKYVYEEDFIEAYKDSNDQFIQLMINGLVEDFLDTILTDMSNFAHDLYNLLRDKDIDSLEYYNTLFLSIYDNYYKIEMYYNSYVNNCDKIWWDQIDHDIEYWWSKESAGCDLPALKTVLSPEYKINMDKMIKEAKQYVRK